MRLLAAYSQTQGAVDPFIAPVPHATCGGAAGPSIRIGSYGILELFRRNQAVDIPRKPSRHLDLLSGRDMLKSLEER